MGRLARRLARMHFRAPCADYSFHGVDTRCAVPTWARSIRESTCPPREDCDVRVRLWLWWERADALVRVEPSPWGPFHY